MSLVASNGMDRQSLLRSTPSFIGAPIGDFEDLKPGCVVLAGVFCDHFAGGKPGSRFAPRQLRYVGRDRPRAISQHEAVIDIGDLNVFPLQPQRNAQILTVQSEKIAARGAKLLAIGGDYSVTPHLIEGLIRAHQGKSIGFARLSRRVDFQDPGNPSTRASATYRISELLGGDRSNILLVGAASPLAIEDLAIEEKASEGKADAGSACIVPMRAITSSENTQLEQALRRLGARCDAVYLSVDADILSPLYGETSMLRSGTGLGPASLLALLEQFAGIPLIGADVMGHVPDLDLAGAPIISAWHGR